MLGPIGSNLMTLLRVLTPAEIDRYSEEVLNNAEPEVQAIAAGAENLQTSYKEHDPRPGEAYRDKIKAQGDEEDSKAKIIPINEQVKQNMLNQESGEQAQDPPHEHEEFRQGLSVKLEDISHNENVKSSGLESIGVLSNSQMKAIEAEKQRKENEKKESTTVFILNQRERLKSSQNKLTEQAAILQYRKNAAHEIIKHELSEEDLEEGYEPNTTDSCGILVNKKHY